MFRPGPESPSTAKRATVFGQLEVLSGKPRLRSSDLVIFAGPPVTLDSSRRSDQGLRDDMIIASPSIIVMCLIVGIGAVVAFWRICAKAGFPGWYGVGVVIPMVNILLVLFLAFAEWPLERKLSGSRPSSDEV